MKVEDLRAVLLSFLMEIKTNNSPHSGRKLSDHLSGTYDLLKKWNCPAAVCVAGGLHSIYGTNVYGVRSLLEKDRIIVRKRFGARAERLAWLFGSVNRPQAIEDGAATDRRTKRAITIDAADLSALRLMEAANLLEQGETLDRWPNISNAFNLQLHLSRENSALTSQHN